MWWVEKENGKLKLTFLSSGLLIGAVFYQYFFWCQQMCNVNTNAMFGEAMPLARWRVTDIHEYLLFLLSLENYYPWTNVETFRVHISLFIPFVQYKRIEQQPPQLRPQTFVTTWKDVNFLPNWKSLQFFSIPELSPCLSFSVTPSPCWTFPPCLFLKSWHSHLFCESKNSDALSVWIWSDDQLKADWFHWRFQRLWGVYWILRQRNRQSPRPTLLRCSRKSFAREKWDFEAALAIRIVRRPGQTDRSKINSPDYWMSAVILCCRPIFY